jgi:hypothetical protein
MVDLCRDVACLDDPKTTGLARRASQLLPRIEPKISKVRIANRKDRDTKRATRLKSSAELHLAVMERARGKGELCGKPLRPFWEMCHLNGGIGRKRQHESIENCVAEHYECHNAIDAAPLEWLAKVQAWAARYGYPIPERFRQMAALRGVPILAVEKISKTMEADAPVTPKEERCSSPKS